MQNIKKSRPTIANPKSKTINLIAVNTKDELNKYKMLYEVLNNIRLYEMLHTMLLNMLHNMK